VLASHRAGQWPRADDVAKEWLIADTLLHLDHLTKTL